MTKKYQKIYEKYKDVRLGLNKNSRNDPQAKKIVNAVNNLSDKTRAYTTYQLKKDPAGMMIKMYLLSRACDEPDERLEALMMQWNVSEQQFQKHYQELIEDGLLHEKK